MANNNALENDTAVSLDRYVLAQATGVPLGATGNAVAVLPIMRGGITNTTGAYIVRGITVCNANGSLSTANVTVLTSSDGNSSNAVSNNVVLSSVTTAITTYQDLGLVAGAATTAYQAPALFVRVNTAIAGRTCDIKVIGLLVNA